MPNKKQEAQPKQEALQAQEPQATQEEMQQLLSLTWNEIDELPEDKKELVYAEIAKQIRQHVEEHPQIEDAFYQFAQIAKAIRDKFNNMRPSLNTAANALYSFLNRNREVFDLLQKLQPYIDAEIEENPEKYETASITDLLTAAVQRAREDGQEIPTIAAEQGQEPEPIELHFPTGESTQGTFKQSAESPAELLETIKHPGLRPKNYIAPNTTLMNALQTHGIINAGAQDLPVLPANSKRPSITTYVDISGPSLLGPNMTETERQVCNAICSLWEEANARKVPPAFTIEDVYRAMPGGGGKPSKATKEEIISIIDKYRKTDVDLDATEEFRARRIIDEDGTFTISDNFYHARRARFVAKNSKFEVTGYVLLAEPVMLSYAKQTKQLLTTKSDNINICKVKDGRITPELVTMSDTRRAITSYILRRILVMKRDLKEAREALRQYEKRRKKETDLEIKPLSAFRHQSPVILFDTVFEQAGAQTTDRNQQKDNRDFCLQLLEYWKCKTSPLITGYALQKKGRQITGMEINLSDTDLESLPT